jgi:hypothetical protein
LVTKSTRPPGASKWPKLPKEIQSAPDQRWQRGSEYSLTTVAELLPKTYRADGSLVAPPPEDTRSIQRADSGLDQLLRSGRITGTEVAAGRRFARDFEFGFFGASDPDRRLHLGRAEDGGNYSARDRYESARIYATTRFRKASQAVGKRGSELLVAFCVESLSMGAIARREAPQRVLAADAAARARADEDGVPWTPPAASLEDRTAKEADVIRRDLSGQLVAVLTRLVEHYDEEEQARRRVRKQTQSTGEDMTKLKPSKCDDAAYRAPYDREEARNVRRLEEQRARDAAKAAPAGESV